jgi:hypothetical protein
MPNTSPSQVEPGEGAFGSLLPGLRREGWRGDGFVSW